MSLRAALVLSAFIHLAVLIAVDHTAVAPRAALRLPSGTLNVDMVQAVRPARTQAHEASQAPGRPVAAADGKEQDRKPPQVENKTGTASTPPAAAADGAPLNPPIGFPVPDASAPPPDAFTQAMTSFMYSQWLTTMAVQYFKTTHALVLAHLQTALTDDLVRGLDGEQATVAAAYTDKNELSSLAVDAPNTKLKDILQTAVPWNKIPAPGSLSLPYREMFFHVSLEKGKINLRMSPVPEETPHHP